MRLLGTLLVVLALWATGCTSARADEPLSAEQVYALICQPEYLWSCDTMTRIAFRESRFDPAAVNYDCAGNGNGMICAGLMQVWTAHVAPNDWRILLDPQVNVVQAYQVWRSRGYAAWSTY